MNDEELTSAPISDEQKAILDARSTAFEKDQHLGTEWNKLKKTLINETHEYVRNRSWMKK